MGVNHGGLDIFMAQQLLHGANVVAIFEQVGGKAMAKRMAPNPLSNARRTDSLL